MKAADQQKSPNVSGRNTTGPCPHGPGLCSGLVADAKDAVWQGRETAKATREDSARQLVNVSSCRIC